MPGYVSLPTIASGTFGYASWANQVDDNFEALIGLGMSHYLGGSDISTVEGGAGSYTPVIQSMPFRLSGDMLLGFTMILEAFYRTLNSGTSVQVCLWNITDSVAIGEGAVSTATARTQESIAMTNLPTGSSLKWVEMRVKRANTSVGVLADGYLRIRKV